MLQAQEIIKNQDIIKRNLKTLISGGASTQKSPNEFLSI